MKDREGGRDAAAGGVRTRRKWTEATEISRRSERDVARKALA
jgi:hypothetical protein